MKTIKITVLFIQNSQQDPRNNPNYKFSESSNFQGFLTQ